VELKLESRLSAYVALTVVIISVFMAMCKLKDENLVDGMTHVDVKAVDTWGEYQAERIKLHIDENDAAALKVQSSAAAAPGVAAETARLASMAGKYEKELAVLKSEARGYEGSYAKMEIAHNEFDMVDALCAIALALAAVAALTDYVLLLYVAWIIAGVGAVLGISTLSGINLLARLIG
jgi:hypothetical protein